MARVYATTTKGLRIATRCSTVLQFVEAFHRTCDEETIFVPTLAMRPVGLQTAFSVDLAGGQPVLRGLGTVRAAWPTAQNPFKRPGVQIAIERLTAESEKVFAELLRARAATRAGAPRVATPQEPPARQIFDSGDDGDGTVLPMNPLAEINDASLEGLIEDSWHEQRSSPIARG